MITAPFGTWTSPITSEVVASGAMRLGDVVLSNGVLYLTESRPTEGGRSVLVAIPLDGAPPYELTAPPLDVRTRVHEYGGGAFTVTGSTVYFSNLPDGRVYGVTRFTAPRAVTPDGPRRYAALRPDDARGRILAVLEDHSETVAEPRNSIVGLSLHGASEIEHLVQGADFYSSPRVSPDGRALAWLSWNHPNMPWDATELWVGSIGEDGRIHGKSLVAGGPEESILQPEWSADGALYFLSDASGYWNLSVRRGSDVRPVCPMEAELGVPHWVFETSTYAVLADGRVLATWTERGRSTLGLLHPSRGTVDPIALPFTEISEVRAEGRLAVFGAASPSTGPCLVSLDLETLEHRVVRELSTTRVDARFISEPRPVTFPTTGGKVAHGLFYPPKNPDFVAPSGAPPLLVKSHGGPTAAASTALNLRTQYYTSRGVGVLDVDYRGSSGYGRAYRKELDGNWGIADVDDCVQGALFLVERGEADPERIMITGGSAGGFTTLAALTFRRVFKAGASHYGISDLEALARDTHKFESRYLERLIGPYPVRADLYRDRSPIHHVDSLSCPVIFFQGLEDKVVPPNQAEMMVEALRKKGILVRYVAFEGEHHGFRRAENVRRVVDEEYRFFAEVLGFAGSPT